MLCTSTLVQGVHICRDHGINNYTDTKAKYRPIKKLPVFYPSTVGIIRDSARVQEEDVQHELRPHGQRHRRQLPLRRPGSRTQRVSTLLKGQCLNTSGNIVWFFSRVGIFFPFVNNKA